METTFTVTSVAMEAEGQGQSDKKPTHCLVEEEFIIGVPLVGVVCLANGQGNIIVLVSLYNTCYQPQSLA